MGIEQKISWDQSLFPLTVLFSPNLRLRYRAAWETQVASITAILNRALFNKPVEASHHQAFGIECQKADLLPGTVYVEDDYKGVSGHVSYVYVNNYIVAATIFLPKEEDNPYDTNKVTLNQIFACLGLKDGDIILGY
jgi:hypothetical protein